MDMWQKDAFRLRKLAKASFSCTRAVKMCPKLGHREQKLMRLGMPQLIQSVSTLEGVSYIKGHISNIRINFQYCAIADNDPFQS